MVANEVLIPLGCSTIQNILPECSTIQKLNPPPTHPWPNTESEVFNKNKILKYGHKKYKSTHSEFFKTCTFIGLGLVTLLSMNSKQDTEPPSL